ncbi:hemerythrin domain-containing protein [Streptomyces sp. NPDC085639]|uniref:hemerythrin domain-containing protein n=1 Tax=Streptomyces sp. NPDC085639 TaxID=3365734 RepID=UPI0037CD51B1
MSPRTSALLPRLVRAVPAGATDRAAVVADHLAEYMTGLHHHHTVEDETLWPLLRARTADQELVARMEEQHGRIDASLAAARLGCGQAAQGPSRRYDGRPACRPRPPRASGTRVASRLAQDRPDRAATVSLLTGGEPEAGVNARHPAARHARTGEEVTGG